MNAHVVLEAVATGPAGTPTPAPSATTGTSPPALGPTAEQTRTILLFAALVLVVIVVQRVIVALGMLAQALVEIAAAITKAVVALGTIMIPLFGIGAILLAVICRGGGSGTG